MSFMTWLEEYYPVAAANVNVEDALAHSRRKWPGLRSENLTRHGVYVDKHGVVMAHGQGHMLGIDSSTCALCVHHLREQDYKKEWRCKSCPLYTVRGMPCDRPRMDMMSPPSPWHIWVELRDPEPMIALLDAAIASQENRPKPH